MSNHTETRLRRQLTFAFGDIVGNELVDLAAAKGGEMTEHTKQQLRKRFTYVAEGMIDNLQAGSPIEGRQVRELARAACTYWVPRELNNLLA